VLSVLLLLVGGIAYTTLPVAQYPEITPPTIVVRASYPGADAQTVAATVATPLEQQINGVEDMLYMSSYSTADGSMALTITFRLGTDLDKAQVLVQNRVAIADAAPAPGGAHPRRHHAEELARSHDGRAHALARRIL
jgi:HAE1 family hydrophobic/amphiphilic exporter-1